MADIRIKDLTTTASSSASDDFIAVDGTTNGTRKLNAFSPTFGGNATVTGTLTGNGGVTVGGGSFAAASFYKSASLGSVLSGATGSSYDLYITNPAGNYILQVPTGTRNAEFAGTLTTVGNATIGAALTVSATTASTTTSTGALVVGNGTSGGLGVGGAANIGGKLAVGAAVLSDRMFYVSGSTGTTGASQFSAVVNPTIPNTVTTGAYGLYLGTNIAAGATVTNSYSLYVASPDYTGSTITNKYGLYSADTNPSYFAGKLSIADTTASTSTSSGALVVSGGVGVAGAIFAGGAMVSNPLHTVARKIEAQIAHSVSTEDYVRISSNSGTTNTYGGEFGYGLTAGGSPQIKFNRVHAGTVTTWLTVPTSSGDAEFAGSLKTAAPSGGTAAAWKLGTVASVSPTSPNRTIEVDIGGTIYYIHAKTTNN